MEIGKSNLLALKTSKYHNPKFYAKIRYVEMLILKCAM